MALCQSLQSFVHDLSACLFRDKPQAEGDELPLVALQPANRQGGILATTAYLVVHYLVWASILGLPCDRCRLLNGCSRCSLVLTAIRLSRCRLGLIIIIIIILARWALGLSFGLGLGLGFRLGLGLRLCLRFGLCFRLGLALCWLGSFSKVRFGTSLTIVDPSGQVAMANPSGPGDMFASSSWPPAETLLNRMSSPM